MPGAWHLQRDAPAGGEPSATSQPLPQLSGQASFWRVFITTVLLKGKEGGANFKVSGNYTQLRLEELLSSRAQGKGLRGPN